MVVINPERAAKRPIHDLSCRRRQKNSEVNTLERSHR